MTQSAWLQSTAADKTEMETQSKDADGRSYFARPLARPASVIGSAVRLHRMQRLMTAAILLVFLLQQAPLASGRLLHVSLVFRHGHRAPIHPLPNDSYTVANTWHDGLGQLTNLGKQNQFLLGQFLKARYGQFFGSRYNSSDHRIRSSNIDRTLMSAQACLAGLFPPAADQVWQQGLNWQPIPVHTVSTNADPLLLPHDFSGCAQRFNRLSVAARMESTDWPKFETEMDSFLRRLSVEAGSSQRPYTLNNIYKLVDTLMVLRTANLSLPAWSLPPDTQNRLRLMGEFSWRHFALTPEVRQMRIGVLIDRLIGDMEAAAAGRLPNRGGGRKLTIYSGHDVTLVPLLAVLGSPDYAVWPNYAACLMFELHSTSSTGGQAGTDVRIFYRNDSRREPLRIPVPGCAGSPCPLENFANHLAGVRLSPDQFSNLCSAEAVNNIGYKADPSMPTILISIAVALPVAILLVVVVHVCFIRSWLRRRMEAAPPIAYHSLLGEVEN